MRNYYLILLILFSLTLLVSCGKSETPDNLKIDKYEIKISERTYDLYKNYLLDEEVYILSNIVVETGNEVFIIKNGDVIDVNIGGRNNVIRERDKLIIHNNATAQILLSINNDSIHLQISGYDGSYTDLESTVKDGYVVGYSYDNHISYTGYIKNGVPHGEGIYVWSMTNCIYFGEFSEGKYEGNGTFVWHNGDKLIGTFSKGAPVQGVYTYASSGCTYNGTFNSGWKYDGTGIFAWPSGWKYEGEFSNGKAINGKTKTNKSSGLIWYEGAMNDLNNIKSSLLGYGYFIQSDGTIYEGQMYSSGALETCVYSGVGKLIYPSGEVVNGIFAGGVLIERQ